MKINILISIENFSSTGGAALTMLDFANLLTDHNVYTCCRNVVDESTNNKIIPLCGEDYSKFVKENDIQLIHYFKSEGLLYFDEIVKTLKRSNLYVPIITTVCQKPSFEGCALTLNEIINSSKLVFIDKAAYNDKVYFYIRKKNKRMIYFGFSSEIIYETSKKKNVPHNSVIFGCGCTLNKIYERYLEVFDKIQCYNKKLVYVGSCKNSWIEEKVLNRDNIEIYPLLEYKLWQNLCKNFDIFLYVLSPNTYSSIDGNLGLAMLYEIPPIVYGPAAPKERIKHGVNGFIAKTEKDVVKYAELLAHNESLRRTMGKEARISTIENFTMNETIKLYDKLYKKVLLENPHKKNVFLINLIYLFISNIINWKKRMIAKKKYVKRKIKLLIKMLIRYNKIIG